MKGFSGRGKGLDCVRSLGQKNPHSCCRAWRETLAEKRHNGAGEGFRWQGRLVQGCVLYGQVPSTGFEGYKQWSSTYRFTFEKDHPVLWDPLGP